MAQRRHRRLSVYLPTAILQAVRDLERWLLSPGSRGIHMETLGRRGLCDPDEKRPVPEHCPGTEICTVCLAGAWLVGGLSGPRRVVDVGRFDDLYSELSPGEVRIVRALDELRRGLVGWDVAATTGLTQHELRRFWERSRPCLDEELRFPFAPDRILRAADLGDPSVRARFERWCRCLRDAAGWFHEHRTELRLRGGNLPGAAEAYERIAKR